MSYESGLIDELRERAQKAEAEVTRLQNAAKSRLRCPEGHSPSQSRGPCWFCDAQRNAELLAKVTEEVKTLRGAIAAQDARDLAACERVGIPPQGCDTADELADEVLGLKAELADLLPLWPHRDHNPRCKAPYDQRAECTCPAFDANTAREKALKLVGVPNGR